MGCEQWAMGDGLRVVGVSYQLLGFSFQVSDFGKNCHSENFGKN